MSYQFLDAYSSVLTAASSVVGGAHQPIVQIQSVLSALPIVISKDDSSNVRGRGSVVGVASIALIPAAGSGIRNYITDVTVVNTGTTTSQVDFTDGDGSVLGVTIAPAGGGSNIVGMVTPMKTSPNQPFNISARSASSIITAFAYGYKL